MLGMLCDLNTWPANLFTLQTRPHGLLISGLTNGRGELTSEYSVNWVRVRVRVRVGVRVRVRVPVRVRVTRVRPLVRTRATAYK